MPSAKPKQGNIKVTLSITEELDNAIRDKYRHRGDYSLFVENATRKELGLPQIQPEAKT